MPTSRATVTMKEVYETEHEIGLPNYTLIGCPNSKAMAYAVAVFPEPAAPDSRQIAPPAVDTLAPLLCVNPQWVLRNLWVFPG